MDSGCLLARILTVSKEHSQWMLVAISMGFEMIFILFWSGPQCVDFEMLLIGLPVDSGKDLGWIPNCHCKVRFPGRILKCFWSGSPLMLEGHCMGFRLNLLWFAEFSIDSEMFWYDSPSILKGLCRDAPLTLERFGMDFDWFWWSNCGYVICLPTLITSKI